MMRPARFIDTPRIVELLVEQHQSSRYAAVTDVDVDYTKRMVGQMIQRHGGIHDGATCCYVIENDEGIVEAFIFGMLDRVYEIGTALVAWDKFLVCSPRAPSTAMMRLLNGYLEWADNNPKVIEIGGSWTDVLPTGERMDSVFTRKGFTRCGAIYRRASNTQAQGIAA